MELSALKNTFNIFTPQRESEFPRITLNLVGGIIINIDNNDENKITLTKDYMMIDNSKTISFICLDSIIKITIHKN